jgi:antitoxin component YwqK of YwqJK toxin-antitoxin module
MNGNCKFFGLVAVILLLVSSSINAQENTNKLDADGKKDGPWKGLFEESKRVRYEGVFNHGKETGVFTFYDDTKAHTVVATHDFTKKNNAAYTTFYDPDHNVVSEGNVINKMYDGKWTYYHYKSKTVMTTEFYKNGKLDGKRTVFYPDGKIAEETSYKNGIKNGAYKKYTDKGIVLEDAVFVNGEYHGPAVYKDVDGNIVSKGLFKNGKKDGLWQFFENGKLVKTEKYPLTKKKSKPKAQ